MTEETLTVDSKGRIHLPKKLRERLGLQKVAKATISDNKLVIEPASDPLDELAAQLDFTFTSIADELPSLKRIAEKQLIKEAK